MKVINTDREGVYIVEAAPISDNRGAFARWFCAKELEGVLDGRAILQINHSKTLKKGAIRGLHYQKSPHAEVKFVRCLRGRVWDLALDLRAGSKTFFKYHAVELTPDNNRMLVIPEGCAHGFQALEAESELLYLHTAYYEPKSEGGVHYADPMASIVWPLPPTEISARDAQHPFLTNAFKGI